ncbi:Gfo/Idh/MocA family protein [Pseudothermotoga thermarum]|nr:Gfo/Idh/MocA family oxidoreductase [Pseudothermotoga thermarum]
MALIGCGRISSKHLEAIFENKDLVKLVACCDLIPQRAEIAAEKVEKTLGYKPEVYTDFRKLLKREDIDFVAIATPSGSHYEISIEAMEHSKNVLVEKPMALSTDHMNHMIELSKRKNLKLGVCFQNRFNPPIQELRKKIETGQFGRIFYGTISVRWNRNKEYYQQAPWRGTWEQDGGVLMNQSTHGIDLLQWMLGGKPKKVFALIKNFNHPYIEAEDFGVGIVEFESGAVGIIEGTSNVFDKNLEESLAIFGEFGTVKIGGLAVNRVEAWRFVGEEGHPFMNLPDPDTVYGKGHIPLYRDFCLSIIEGREPLVNGEEGRKAVEIVLGIYKSALENKWVEFPVNFSTDQMKGVLWAKDF